MAAISAFSELRPPLDTDAALLEADRCLFSAGPYAPPPRAAACPAGVDVPRFVREIADGRPLAAAVETRFWPLYEVVVGRYRPTYEPTRAQPIARRLEGQKRFAHLLRPENDAPVESIQQTVDRDWAELRSLCHADVEEGALP